ncbi:hypothetical protein ALT_6563 [Aspergillus lentulus]|uniref:Uncharacterized protein n=1 Tax=Aspergillus lentulus TaxID=293939 RepID=A0AAN4PMU2_ASPLE|nr:hypothetical protein ALT_6563 [Aspergillus lentulus]GFF64670.1 hypothetical protein IFM60648_01345 [Aspergillus lentulus]
MLCLESRDRLVDSCPDGLGRVAFIADHAAKSSGQMGVEPLGGFLACLVQTLAPRTLRVQHKLVAGADAG